MGNLWCLDKAFNAISFGLKFKTCLYKTRSQYYDIQVLDSDVLGRALVLNNVLQVTEKDGFIRYEMLTHVAMASAPLLRRVLIIGGIDGGVLREVLKYPVKEVYIVEKDQKVIDVSKKYLSKICGNSFEDKRTKFFVCDAVEFVKKHKDFFDVVIVDSPKTKGIDKTLSMLSFCKDIFRSLSKDGIMICQAGSNFFQPEILKAYQSNLKKVFSVLEVYGMGVPSCVGGILNIVFASKTIQPNAVDFRDVLLKYRKFCANTKYYNPKIHFCSFTLPKYIEGNLK